MNYDKDLEIDRDSLDEEWIKQPSLYAKYAEEYRKAKAKFDDVKSRLTLEIKLDHKKFLDVDKITDKIIESILLRQPEFVEAKKNKKIFEHAEEAFGRHRKKALEGLVQLYIGEYFSKPKQPKEDENISNRVAQKSSAFQRRSLNTKREK